NVTGVQTCALPILFSHFQKTANTASPMTKPMMTAIQLALPALPASLTAKVMAQTLMTKNSAPHQSTLMPLDGLDSGAQIATMATAIKPTMAINQNTERKPQFSAIQPDTSTSTPATPPL